MHFSLSFYDSIVKCFCVRVHVVLVHCILEEESLFLGCEWLCDKKEDGGVW